jgi:hypothetical protein
MKQLFACAVAAVLSSGCAHQAEENEVGQLRQAVTTTSVNPALQHRLLIVESNAGAFTVVSNTLLDGRLPKLRKIAVGRGWGVRAKDSAGTIIHTDMVANPHTLRGAFDENDGSTSGVFLTTSTPAQIGLRVPAVAETVEFFEGSALSGAAASNLLGSLSIN